MLKSFENENKEQMQARKHFLPPSYLAEQVVRLMVRHAEDDPVHGWDAPLSDVDGVGAEVAGDEDAVPGGAHGGKEGGGLGKGYRFWCLQIRNW